MRFAVISSGFMFDQVEDAATELVLVVKPFSVFEINSH
jgi:hypothetical protein